MGSIQTIGGRINNINGAPQKCPYCHKTIVPIELYGHIINTARELEVIFICPNFDCYRSFIAYYIYVGNSNYNYRGFTSIGNTEDKIFTENLLKISKSFVTIYNQAYTAEQYKLDEIWGVGYRKALEFLIKDYLKINKPNEIEDIEKKPLGKCINDYVDDIKIKTVAKRAVWLGNDETHYTRKWEEKDLKDLKILIDLTVHWIEMETLTKTFEEEMPEKK